MTFNQIIEKLKVENAASKEKYGFWRDISDHEQAGAVLDEFAEWHTAYVKSDVDGEHGELAELLDLMNVCMRRYMFLTGEQDA